METIPLQNRFVRTILSYIQHYNHKKYWRRRAIVVDPKNKTNVLIKLYYLYYIKKADSWHNCSFGTNLNSGTHFETPPYLLHGPNGIIVGHNLSIGKNVTICQQVTLAHNASTIGDNVFFGPGSKLVSGNIGNNVNIGANAIVIEDIPDNATVVLQRPRIIVKERVPN